MPQKSLPTTSSQLKVSRENDKLLLSPHLYIAQPNTQLSTQKRKQNKRKSIKNDKYSKTERQRQIEFARKTRTKKLPDGRNSYQTSHVKGSAEKRSLLKKIKKKKKREMEEILKY